MQKKADIKTCVVGMDGRIHSEAIRQATCLALIDSGIDVVCIGVCPSPVVNFALHTLGVDMGIMITASHNPKEYNGFKISLGTDPVWGPAMKAIATLYEQKKRNKAVVQGKQRTHDLIPTYVAWLVDHFSCLQGMDLAVLIDCANGVAGTVLPSLISSMHWKRVQLLYSEVDGTYPHHEADPTVISNMGDVQRLLATDVYDIGIGLDGDCDRMAPMTKDGELILGDKLLAFFAQPLLQAHPGATVVFDIKSSAGLIELLHQFQAVPYVSATGHTNIKEQMKQQDALLGGELSCHFFFRDRYFGYDDGIYAMLRLFECIVKGHISLEEFLTQFPTSYVTPEYRVPCSEALKWDIVEHMKQHFIGQKNVELMTLDGVRVVWIDGWGLIRASNTQPVLSLRFEGKTQASLDRIKKEFFEVLAWYVDPKDFISM